MINKLQTRYRYSFILLRELVITDFKLRYQGSTLGYLWALLRPLFLFAILYVFFVEVLHIGKEIEHWGVALLLGIVLWNFFSEVVKQGLKSVTSSGGIIRKINFPKYIIVISTSLSALINLVINLVVVGIFATIDGVGFSWGLLLLPVFIIELYVFGIGLAFLLSAINVRFRDVSYIWDVVSQALFYGSAIMFPINRVVSMSHDIALLLLVNPLTQAIQDARYFGITQGVQTTHVLTDNVFIIVAPFLIAVAFCIVGALYFRHRSPSFAEEV
ncbi:MAG TPA: ABC transporter permease [Candidatus Saccharimonadales bacterium]